MREKQKGRADKMEVRIRRQKIFKKKYNYVKKGGKQPMGKKQRK